VPTIHVTKEKATAHMKRLTVVMKDSIDDQFFDTILCDFNHQSLSAMGWLNHRKYVRKNKRWKYVNIDPFKGNLSLLQCGPISTTIPDYRKFHVS
jgi:hypothetical protein